MRLSAQGFDADDQMRYRELSERSQSGQLSEAEGRELDDLLTANDVLTILHAKAGFIESGGRSSAWRIEQIERSPPQALLHDLQRIPNLLDQVFDFEGLEEHGRQAFAAGADDGVVGVVAEAGDHDDGALGAGGPGGGEDFVA